MKNIGMKEADFRNYIDNNFVNAIKKGNRPVRKRNYPFNASGADEYAGTPADLDYQNRYPDIKGAVEAYAKGWGGYPTGYAHYIDAGKAEGRIYDFDLNKASEAARIIKPSNKVKYLFIGIAIIGVIALVWKYRSKLGVK